MPPRSFPCRSVLIFIVGAIVLRCGAVAAWALFPREEGFQQFARVAVPLLFTVGLLVLNQWLLRRDRFSPQTLGLGIRRLPWFVVGAAVVTVVVLAVAGGLWVLVPFHWEQGTLGGARFGWQFAEYFAGNFGEELMFRGYLLVVIARHFGMGWAVAITGLLFGLFHLPGLSGVAALKMICTTASGSLLFAAGYLLSGTLWTAVGMHVCGNLLLHQGLGLSGQPALARVVFEESWPTGYDPAFAVWLAINVTFAAVLFGVFGKYRISQRGVVTALPCHPTGHD